MYTLRNKDGEWIESSSFREYLQSIIDEAKDRGVDDGMYIEENPTNGLGNSRSNRHPRR